jgi:type II secretory pathway predicted ATPase ExeA
MRAEVMDYYGLVKPLNRAGYYETEHQGQLLKNIRGAILEGRIIVLYGVIGSGKTVTLRRLQQQLKDENKSHRLPFAGCG